MALLEVKNIDVYYGEGQALFDVSLDIGKEETIALLGRNGAGKTTTLKAIMGINKPKRTVSNIMITRVILGRLITCSRNDPIIQPALPGEFPKDMWNLCSLNSFLNADCQSC